MKESSQSHAKEARKGCRKREQPISGGDEQKAAPESKSLPLKYGYVSLMGRRRVMEEPMTVMPPEKLPGGYSFLAAYGGSGRAMVAETCTDKLHECLEKLAETDDEEGFVLGKVVKEFFSGMYEKWSWQERETFTAAVVVAGEKGEVVVVNCGGSRAVLWSGGAALPLWTDHNKVDEGEGGKRRWEAEVRVMRRDEKSEDFVIIANDGLWKVVGKEMACEVVRKCVAGEMRSSLTTTTTTTTTSRGVGVGGGGGASQAAAILAELAIARGSEDNITIIVVHLNST